MSKNIVILNGSPRKKGNSSELVRAFSEGAKESGNEVKEFFLDRMYLHSCRGCFGGHNEKEYPCVQKDDMADIYTAVRKSNVIVFATPLYYWNFSGQLKTVIDRLFALEEGDENQLRGNGRAGALLMAAEGYGFEDMIIYFDNLMKHLQYDNLGHVLAGGNNLIGDIKGKQELKDAFELGKSIQ